MVLVLTVMDLLGHKSIQMTMRYSDPTPENKKNAVNLLINKSEKNLGSLEFENLQTHYENI